LHNKTLPFYSVDFENVPVEKLAEIEPKFRESLEEIINGGAEKFDMDRLHTISKNRHILH
jgi:hypothetical protein